MMVKNSTMRAMALPRMVAGARVMPSAAHMRLFSMVGRMQKSTEPVKKTASEKSVTYDEELQQSEIEKAKAMGKTPFIYTPPWAILERLGITQEEMFGPGAAPGEIANDLDQATGLERLELLGQIKGIDVLNTTYRLPAERVGTLKDPVMVDTVNKEYYIGCTGVPTDSHDIVWMTLDVDYMDGIARCTECGSVYKSRYHAPPPGWGETVTIDTILESYAKGKNISPDQIDAHKDEFDRIAKELKEQGIPTRSELGAHHH